MRGAVVEVTEQLFVEECCNCGIPFAMTEQFKEERVRDKRLFYCPNGHSQSYRGESFDAEVRRLRRERDEKADAAKRLERQRNLAQKKLKEIEGRVANGVCPHCNRSFVQLARHMKSKHPDCVA
jgi:hypothetical protein